MPNPLWIAQDGSDVGGLGTESMPFRTVDAAVAVAPATGQDILAKPGFYGAQNITKAGIRLRAADPERQPILYGGGALVGWVRSFCLPTWGLPFCGMKPDFCFLDIRASVLGPSCSP